MNTIDTIKSLTIAGNFDLAKRTAVTEADNAAAVAGLPTYTELVEALRKHQQFNDGHSFVEISSVTDRKFKALGKESAALLARITD